MITIRAERRKTAMAFVSFISSRIGPRRPTADV
jgi:hypothetical protein